MTKHHRILAVEDSPLNLAILVEMLADDYELRCAESGESGLALAREFRPDLVLLDIMMPGLDGYDTCARLRQDPDLRGCKVILISSMSELTDRLKGYAAGADDFVMKPYNEDELRAKIGVFLRLKTVEELDHLKANILKLMSHETRTPLNGIVGSLQLLADSTAFGRAEQEMIQLAMDSTANLERLLTKGLLYSELRSGTVALNPATLDLSALLRELVGELGALAMARGVVIDLQMPAKVGLSADPELLRFLCRSIIENAIEHSPRASAVRVAVQPEGDGMCLTVLDSGPGIDPGYRPYLFAGLISPDIAHHMQGQGLSLAIAKEIVQLHRGTIGVDPPGGRGACFRVQLPSLRQSPTPVPEPALR